MTVYTLPKKTLTVWRIRTIACFIVLFCFLLLFFKLKFVLVYIGLPLLATVLLLISFYLPCFYKKYVLEMHPHAAVIKKGVYIEREYVMPYGGMIYAELVETPLSRQFGLTGVKLHASKKSISISLLEHGQAEAFILLVREHEKRS